MRVVQVQCDRCGAPVQKERFTRRKMRLPLLIKHYWNPDKDDTDRAYVFSGTYDFCEKCRREFDKWMFEKKGE